MTRFFVIMALVGMPSAALAQSAPVPVLMPGDLVRIVVYRRPELSGELEVAADSSLRHPLYRGLKVAGIPFPEAEERIRVFLQGFQTEPQFVVDPLYRIAVGGQVRAPNLYSLRPEMTVDQAIAVAGGPTDRGRLDRVRVIRDGRELKVDLTRRERAPIKSGDQILVPAGGSFFRDVLLPIAGLTAALASVYNVFRH
jgi:polysaccharide export outer membrane protein